eukprot:TRINITY_DN12360_c0_g1_i7.p2 TRINITY_DN12360_c0_g1~~TRINITY_DN12360_c0_g1_i7.p2  ORF type:complete len:231 (+),score=42.09 TRINITY_DN12360_c0_g1_i7:149-841(+)
MQRGLVGSEMCIRDRANADTKDDVKMKIQYGIEGKYKYNLELPINVEIENTGSDINGQLEVRVQANDFDKYDAFVKDVSVKAGEKKIVSIPVYLYENTFKIAVLLKEGDKVIKETTMIVGNGRIDKDSMLIGTLSDDVNGIGLRNLNFDSNGRHGGIDKRINVQVTSDLLKQSYKNFAALDMLIINNYNISNFTENQYKNILQWVSSGGILIIGTGENSAKTIKKQQIQY